MLPCAKTGGFGRVFEDDGAFIDEATGGDGAFVLVVNGSESASGGDAAHAAFLLGLRRSWLLSLRGLGLLAVGGRES